MTFALVFVGLAAAIDMDGDKTSGLREAVDERKTFSMSGATAGAKSKSGNIYNGYQILEGEFYADGSPVTCESQGYLTISDLDECQAAGAAESGDPNKGFRFDQPDGGYTTTSSDRTFGCTFHNSDTDNDLQFFPHATGPCGTANFDCVCGVPACTGKYKKKCLKRLRKYNTKCVGANATKVEGSDFCLEKMEKFNTKCSAACHSQPLDETLAVTGYPLAAAEPALPGLTLPSATSTNLY